MELRSRPKPYTGQRDRLEKDMAVLLMRTSYQVRRRNGRRCLCMCMVKGQRGVQVADDLDFIPMDRFQKNFVSARLLVCVITFLAFDGSPPVARSSCSASVSTRTMWTSFRS
jgi:hypothetical protein